MEHVFTESMFLVGFVIFIAAILVLDMLVIDRKAHVVSIKEAGSWTGFLDRHHMCLSVDDQHV